MSSASCRAFAGGSCRFSMVALAFEASQIALLHVTVGNASDQSLGVFASVFVDGCLNAVKDGYAR